MPLERADLALRGQVPQPHQPVHAAAEGVPAVRRQGHAGDNHRLFGQRSSDSPSCTFHSRIMRSCPPLSACLPSAATATLHTGPSCPAQAQRAAGLGVPQPQRAVVAGGNNLPAVSGEDNRIDVVAVAGRASIRGGRLRPTGTARDPARP